VGHYETGGEMLTNRESAEHSLGCHPERQRQCEQEQIAPEGLRV